jgi:hypothetical protein
VTETPRPAAPLDLGQPAGRPDRVRRVPASAPAPPRRRRPLLATAPPGVQRAAAGTRRALLVFAAAAGVLVLIIGPCVLGLIWEWNRVQ